MINVKDQVFRLETKNTTYAFRINEGYLEHLYYGRRVVDIDFSAAMLKNTIDLGCTVKEEGSKFFLERNLLEYSGVGRGDYRHSPMELLMPDGTFVCDFVYESHTVIDGAYKTENLPTAYGDAKTLVITMKDKKFEDIKDHIKKVVDTCAPGGGFVFMPDKAFVTPGDVNPTLFECYNFAHEYSKK